MEEGKRWEGGKRLKGGRVCARVAGQIIIIKRQLLRVPEKIQDARFDRRRDLEMLRREC